MAGLLGQLADSFFAGRGKHRIDRRRSLALKPLRNPDVNWGPQEPDDSQPLIIEIPLQRKPVPKPILWFASKLARRKPPDKRRLELDPVGAFVWRAADGERTVRQLIWQLAAEYKLNRRDAETALLEFMGKLSVRNLLGFANMARPDS
jgi:hypothetical protein